MDATEMSFTSAGEGVLMDDPFSFIIPERIVANNITPEAIIKIMAESNLRFLIWSDELAGFLKNLNKYNSGSDSELLLSIFSSQTIIKDLKTQEKVIIKDPFACIAGTTQPDVLKTMFKYNENIGLRDRFLFVVLDSIEKSKMIREDLSPEVVKEYCMIINKILGLEYNSLGLSTILNFTEEAEEYAFNWYNDNAEKINESEDDMLSGIYTKLDTYYFRFCLIIQILRWSCGEADKDFVDIKSAAAAKDLVEFFRYMNTRALKATSPDPLESMTDLQAAVYDKFNLFKDGEFRTSDGIDTAIKAGMSKRACQYFLKDQRLFKRIKTGRYKKLL